MKTSSCTVLTGDIINFTKLDEQQRQTLIEHTTALLESWVPNAQNAAVFRGDSYQLILDNFGQALRRSIQLVCWFIKSTPAGSRAGLSTRVSIGLGAVAYRGRSVLDSDGEAFHLSGRNFDNMRAGELIRIKTADAQINSQIDILLNFINLILNHWTRSQAEIVYLELEGYTQQHMADVLQIAQSAVSSRLKASQWKEAEKGIAYISDLIESRL